LPAGSLVFSSWKPFKIVHLSELLIYPVKSLRGIGVSSAEIDALGLVGDRRFLVVDQQGQFLTQRTLPRMALIETELTSTDLILRTSQLSTCTVPLRAPEIRTTRSVSVWKSIGLNAEDCGDEPANWLTAFLGVACRLVRIGKEFHRPVLNPAQAREGDVLAFADAYPFLVIGEASLADLNDRLISRGEESVPMNRFRPNLVISGSRAFAEDSWKSLSIGAATFRAAGLCERCIVTTTDQLTAERGREPLRTLAAYRRTSADSNAVNFGQNLIHETKAVTLRVGDPVSAL
jgi:uncharacterized protein YcbX